MKDHEYAGFWIRVGANFIDLIIVIVLYSVFSGLLMFAFGGLFTSNIYYQGSCCWCDSSGKTPGSS